MKRNRKERGIQLYRSTGTFEEKAYNTCYDVAANQHTRDAYAADLDAWFTYCRELEVSPSAPSNIDVLGWVEWMKKVMKWAPKTRARRCAAMATIFRRLYKNSIVPRNPFSVDEGPDREKVHPLERTPIATPEAVTKILATCDTTTELGARDEALIRLMWGTGARRASVLTMTIEGLRRAGKSFEAIVIGKGGKEIPLLIRGKSADAMRRWLDVLKASKLSSGPLWRKKSGPMLEKDVWRMLDTRARAAGVDRPSPHSFRVAFLTYNPAGLEAKQHAAGHADPATTRLYDRASWRGREAFEKMPEVEDTEEI